MSRLRSQSGLTIPELIVAMVLIAIMSAVIMGFMSDRIRAGAIASARADLLREAQEGLDTATEDIRLSASAEDDNRWPDNNGPVAGNQYSWQSNGTTLVVATAAEDTQRNVIFDDPNQYITAKNNLVYFVKNRVLYRRTLAAPVSGNRFKTTCPVASATTACPADRVLINNVDSFTVTYRDGQDQIVSPTNARSVGINVSLRSAKFGQQIKASYATRMVFRND